MAEITVADIMSAVAYERARPDLRRRVMQLKNRRRVLLGEHASLHFESRETMLYQVHEMLRAESSWLRPGAVEGELEAYNPLVPGSGELSATLMLEWESPAERAHWLSALRGLEHHTWLKVDDTEPLPATFDRAQASPTRISSVQYLRWALDDERQQRLATEGTAVWVILDHPAYASRAVLSEETRRELVTDLE